MSSLTEEEKVKRWNLGKEKRMDRQPITSFACIDEQLTLAESSRMTHQQWSSDNLAVRKLSSFWEISLSFCHLSLATRALTSTCSTLQLKQTVTPGLQASTFIRSCRTNASERLSRNCQDRDVGRAICEVRRKTTDEASLPRIVARAQTFNQVAGYEKRLLLEYYYQELLRLHSPRDLRRTTTLFLLKRSGQAEQCGLHLWWLQWCRW